MQSQVYICIGQEKAQDFVPGDFRLRIKRNVLLKMALLRNITIYAEEKPPGRQLPRGFKITKESKENETQNFSKLRLMDIYMGIPCQRSFRSLA